MIPAAVRRDSILRLLTVAVPVLLAALLCAIDLGQRSLWLDEGATVSITAQGGGALWRAIGHDGGNMLVYYLLLHAFTALFGDGAAVIRVPSLIADAATAGLTATIGLRLFADRRLAVAAGLLVAVSLPLVYWGQDARGYALMVAFATGSYLCLFSILGAEKPSATAVAGYGICTLLALYIGFDMVLLVPAQLLALAWAPRRARVVGGVLVAVALACMPLAVLATQRGSSQLFWVPTPGPSVLGQALVTLLSAGLPPNFHETAVTWATVAVTLPALAWVVLRAARLRASGFAVRGLVAWLLVPIAFAVAAALAGEPVELARAAILLIPALALLLAWGARCLATLPTRRGARWLLAGRAAGPLVLLVLLGLRLAQVAASYGVSPENWQAAAGHVLAGAPACVLFYPQDGRMAFDYYVSRASPTAAARLEPVLPSAPWAEVRPYVERYVLPAPGALAQIAGRCPRIWVVASHEGQRHGTAAQRIDFARYETLLGTLRVVYGPGRSASFGYAAAVRTTLFAR